MSHVTVSLLLSHWYPGSGVLLDCIDSRSLPPFLLVLTSHRYCSTHWVEVLDILERKKTALQKLPLPRAVFLKGVKRAQYLYIF